MINNKKTTPKRDAPGRLAQWLKNKFYHPHGPPTVSILLPTHNRADVLAFAIRSVLAQTFRDFELLVAGDGCTDNTAAVVNGFKDARIRWFDFPKAPHFGYANRNRALEDARGEFIAFMAHDDLWTPDHLAILLQEFADPAVEWTYSRPLWVEPDGCLIPSSFNLNDPEVLEKFLSRQMNSIPAACVIHRRICLKKYGNWNSELTGSGDWDLWARMITGGGRTNFTYQPLPTCFHFRAHWRTEKNAGPRELAVWRRHFQTQPGFAPDLRLKINAAVSEQANVWNCFQRKGIAGVTALRRSVQTALDRMNFLCEERTLALMQDLEAKNQAISALRQCVAALDPKSLSGFDDSVFGPGFYAEENSARWVDRRACLYLEGKHGPGEGAVLSLMCAEGGFYPRFPFSVHVTGNDDGRQELVFSKSGQILEVTVPLQPGRNTIQLESESVFCPREQGINNDIRQLAVRLTGLEIKINMNETKGKY